MSGIQQMFLGAVPSAVADPNFEYTTLLLPGNGTNGAQNNTYLDSSSNNFTITRSGNVAQGTFSPFSQTGWSGYFDGTANGSLRADSSADTNLSADFTIQAWVFPTANGQSSNSEIMSRGAATTTNGWHFLFPSGTTQPCFQVNYVSLGNTSTSIQSSTNVPLNQWTHIAVTRSGNTARIYINGSLDTTNTGFTTSPTVSGTEYVYVGRASYDTTNRQFTGYISNASIIKGTALTSFNTTTPLSTSTSGQSLLTCTSWGFLDTNTATTAKAITSSSGASVQAFSPFNPTAAWSAATNGGSGYFDQNNDYLSYSPGTTLSGIGTGAITIEAWVYFNNPSFSSYQDIFFTNTSFGMLLVIGKLRFYGMSATAATIDLPIKQWVHVAVVRESGGTLKGYYNGVECFSTTSSTSMTGTTAYIGSGGANVELWPGYLSNVRVSNVARYTANFTPPTSPFVSDANTLFLLGCTNAGILDATAKNDLETVGNAQISTAQSKFGGSSMYFDGTGDYLTSPANELYRLMSGDFTVEMWVRLAATQANMGLVSSFTTNIGWLVRLDTSAVVFSYGTGSASTVVSNSAALSTGQWYHIAWTKYGTTLRSFVDGIQVGANHTVSGASDSTAIGLQVGRTQTVTNDLNGYIDDLRITKGIARYTSNFTPPTTAFPLL